MLVGSLADGSAAQDPHLGGRERREPADVVPLGLVVADLYHAVLALHHVLHAHPAQLRRTEARAADQKHEVRQRLREVRERLVDYPVRHVGPLRRLGQLIRLIALTYRFYRLNF